MIQEPCTNCIWHARLQPMLNRRYMSDSSVQQYSLVRRSPAVCSMMGFGTGCGEQRSVLWGSLHRPVSLPTTNPNSSASVQVRFAAICSRCWHKHNEHCCQIQLTTCSCRIVKTALLFVPFGYLPIVFGFVSSACSFSPCVRTHSLGLSSVGCS